MNSPADRKKGGQKFKKVTRQQKQKTLAKCGRRRAKEDNNGDKNSNSMRQQHRR